MIGDDLTGLCRRYVCFDKRVVFWLDVQVMPYKTGADDLWR